MHWLGAFLGCFMKFEVVNYTPYNKLSLIDVASNVLKLKTYWRWKLVLSLQKNKIQREITTSFPEGFALHVLQLLFIFKRNMC